MKDKISFVIAFLGVIIAFAPFKDILQATVIGYGTHNISVLTLSYISLGMLFISAYLYAIDYIRYGFKFLDGWRLFRYIQIAADSFYLLAIISPVIYFAIWCVTKLAMQIPVPKLRIEEYSSWLNTIMTLASLSFSIYASWFQNKEQRNAKEELLNESSINAENEAKNLVEKNQWNLAIVECYRSLELAINKKLIDLGVDPSRITMPRSVEMLLKNGIIDQSDYLMIQSLRDLRNKSVHSVVEHSKDDAVEAIKNVKKILPKLETSFSNYSFFESKVLSALTNSDGLFLKHHFFTNFDQRNSEFDARAEGPNSEYIIEVKMSKNPMVIRKTLDRLRKHAKAGRRFLIVVPHDCPRLELLIEDVKVLYFNHEIGTFENKEEIQKWIYG